MVYLMFGIILSRIVFFDTDGLFSTFIFNDFLKLIFMSAPNSISIKRA